MTTQKAEQLREEQKASGTEVAPTELDMLLEEILEKENAAKGETKSGDSKKRKQNKTRQVLTALEDWQWTECLRLTPGKVMWGKLLKRRKRHDGAHTRCFSFWRKKCERPPIETRRDKFTKGGARSNDSNGSNDETATTATSGYVSKPANSASTSYVGYPRAVARFQNKMREVSSAKGASC